jgi:hypothetical protein
VTEAQGTPTQAASGDLPLDPVRALSIENGALILRLRAAQIPQHIGMAAAARALAVDLPRVLMAQLEAELKSGALVKRWEAARARAAEPPADVDVDPAFAAAVMLLGEQLRTSAHYLSVRGEEWASDAHRLEGQARALEAQSDRLTRVTAPEKLPGSNQPVSEESAQGS